MPCASLILVETSMAGNLGAAIRVAANFAVPRLDLVRCRVDPAQDEVRRWACGGEQHLEIVHHDSLAAAAATYRTVVATASVRGRDGQPTVSPQEALQQIRQRDPAATALVFGNETRGLSRHDLDQCDLALRIPTEPGFPVLNLTQAVAIVLSYLSIELEPPPVSGPEPAPQAAVDGLMAHLQSGLSEIGFLDPANPERILRKLRRLWGRAGITENEVDILRGICRQMQWAARTGPHGRCSPADHPEQDQEKNQG